MDFQWRIDEEDKNGKPKHLVLYVGMLDNAIATLTLTNRGKTYESWILLPEVRTTKRYADLEVQKADVERVVLLWFAHANMDRPAADSS